MYFIGLTPWAFHLASLVQRPPVLRRQLFDFRVHFCYSAPMEARAFGFRLRANAPEGQKRFPISNCDISAQAQCFVRGSLMPLPNCLIENPFASGKRHHGRLEPHVSN